MVPKPLTFFVLIASAGNRFLQAAAERHPTASFPEVSCRRCLQGPTAHLIGNVAMVCIAPIVLRGQLGQSTSTVTTVTSLVISLLALLSSWFLRQMVSPAGQSIVGACSGTWHKVPGAIPGTWHQLLPLPVPDTWYQVPRYVVPAYADHSGQKGLATSSRWCLSTLPAYLWQLGRQCVQRRRLYLHATNTHFESILSLVAFPSQLAPPFFSTSDRRTICKEGSHGLHEFHEALPKGFLMPLDVAACRSAPEVSSTLQRLLADRWWEHENPQPSLESVPEDECLMWNAQLDELVA